MPDTHIRTLDIGRRDYRIRSRAPAWGGGKGAAGHFDPFAGSDDCTSADEPNRWPRCCGAKRSGRATC